jgi:hypothetical protein
MTLGELTTRKGLCGRVMIIYQDDGFTFRGTITGVLREGIVIHFTLARFARQFRAEDGPWKNLPNSNFTLGKNTLVERVDDGTVSFALPKGGQGYIHPRGKR